MLSPLPWRLKREDDPVGAVIVDRDGQVVTPYITPRDNADSIVHVVNKHDELISALSTVHKLADTSSLDPIALRSQIRALVRNTLRSQE